MPDFINNKAVSSLKKELLGFLRSDEIHFITWMVGLSVGVVITYFLFFSYHTPVPLGLSKDPSNRYLDLLYESAIKDAMNPLPDKIDSSLLSLSRADSSIIDGVKHVKMLSLITSEYIDDYRMAERTKSPYPVRFDAWVSMVPQLSAHLIKEKYQDTTLLMLRVKQLLGLPYQKPYKYFAELWVKPDDIKRPCPDSDPYDTSCLLDFPDNTDSKYREWFNNYRFTIYEADSGRGYPFSQLGYTYDWGMNQHKKGVSEFVILGSIHPTSVYVHRIKEISSYINEGG
ncbi:MAG: hypothetical protein AAGA02_12740 [Bacteroidota bacterium]